MLHAVHLGSQSLDRYAGSAGDESVALARELAEPLIGARILHLNATPYGGGVAEILHSEVPLLRDLGLEAEWRIITGDETFFRVTKTIHNGLQGASHELTGTDKDTYLEHSTRNAQLFEGSYDLVVVHDPQPLALRELRDDVDGRWIWRCHIDTSEPNPQVWSFLRSFVASFDAAVFTMREFVPPDTPVARVEVIPPAIDPESPKNCPLEADFATRVMRWFGIEPDRPLVVQVSRFDPWKDPLGVIAAYRLAREEVPDLQLALVGSMALDDPEGWDIYREIQRAAEHDPQISIATNLTGVGNVEVNAFQRLADVVIQKSIREGFGLVVSETLWKGTPVVAGRSGGIPLQMAGGVGGFLVDTVEECAERILWLLRHPEQARDLAAQGRARVRERFLLPRLLADELRLYRSLLT
jgi:trehalose synthase